MENRPYIPNGTEKHNEALYQQPNIFSNQQTPFDQLYFREEFFYPSPDSIDALADLPFLFGEVPYPIEYPVIDLPQPLPRMEYPPTDTEYTNLNNTQSMGPWSGSVPVLPSFPLASAISPLYSTPQTPFESSPCEESPSTTRSNDYDRSRAMSLSTPISGVVLGASTPSYSHARPKRKASHTILFWDNETQTTEQLAKDKSSHDFNSFRLPISPMGPKPRSPSVQSTQNTEPPTIDFPKSKKLRGLPSSLITVFDANTKPHIKRNIRKSYSEEAKKKVEDVRRIGACSQCRFRKRTVRYDFYFPTLQ